MSDSVTLKLEAIGDNVNAQYRLYRGLMHEIGLGDAAAMFQAPLPAPWVAEITGLDGRYGFARRFLRSRKSYREANSVGSRGVYCYFDLTPGKVYQVSEPRHHRYWCRVEDGQVVTMKTDEVRAWPQVASRFGALSASP